MRQLYFIGDRQRISPLIDRNDHLAEAIYLGPLTSTVSPSLPNQNGLLVLMTDTTYPPALLQLNKHCIKREIELLPMVIMGDVLQIGPLVTKGQACLHCAEIRVRTVLHRGALDPHYPKTSWDIAYIATQLSEFIRNSHQVLVNRLIYCWKDGRTSSHSLLATIHCPDCRHGDQLAYLTPSSISEAEGHPKDSTRILRLSTALVDPVCGIIRKLDSATTGPADPKYMHMVADLADPGWSANGYASLPCGGNALDQQIATAAALGEALERSSACPSSVIDLPYYSYKQIEEMAINPLKWDLFAEQTKSQKDFPYHLPNLSDRIRWVWGHRLINQQAVMVPAHRVFSPFQSSIREEHPDGPIISGYATGSTREEAILGALLEVIERDSFMISWANRLSLRCLPQDMLPDQCQDYYHAFSHMGFEVRCLTIKLDLGAYLVISILRGTRPEEPAWAVAAAADINPVEGCRRALKELSANRLNIKYHLQQHPGLMLAPDPQKITREKDHALLYAQKSMDDVMQPWWESPTLTSIPSVSDTLSDRAKIDFLLANLAEANLDCIVVDLTHPGIKALGLWTVKVLIPGTYPMQFDQRWPHFGGSRISEVPSKLGIRKEATSFQDFNRIPHPFP